MLNKFFLVMGFILSLISLSNLVMWFRIGLFFFFKRFLVNIFYLLIYKDFLYLLLLWFFLFKKGVLFVLVLLNFFNVFFRIFVLFVVFIILIVFVVLFLVFMNLINLCCKLFKEGVFGFIFNLFLFVDLFGDWNDLSDKFR